MKKKNTFLKDLSQMRQTNKGLLGLDGSDRTIISGDLHSVLVV